MSWRHLDVDDTRNKLLKGKKGVQCSTVVYRFTHLGSDIALSYAPGIGSSHPSRPHRFTIYRARIHGRKTSHYSHIIE